MFKKKLIVLAIFFVALVAVSAVSAAEDTEDIAAIQSNTEINEITSDITTDEIQKDSLEPSANDENDGTLAASDDKEILTEGSNCYVNCSYEGEEHYGTKDNPYITLSDALSDREDGDVIWIAAGVYSGEENTCLNIYKNLTLKSLGEGEVIFDGQHEGGSIFNVYADELNVDGITFKNGCSFYGGALYFANGMKNSYINGIFIDNEAMFGGAIYVYGDMENSIISSYFRNNSAELSFGGEGSSDEGLHGFGGAIYVYRSINSSLIDGDFISNRAAMFGGAIYAEEGIMNSNITYYNNFKDNFAPVGGAIATYVIMNTKIESNFANNTALAGGAIFANAVNNTKIDSNFANNTADNDLGSDYISVLMQYIEEYADSDISEYVWQNIEDYYLYYGFGGAISIIEILESSTISGEFENNNGADAGGAVCVLGLVNKSSISGQFTSDYARLGGALFLPFVEYSNITGNFEHNTAVQGGAIFANQLNNTHMNGSFTYNGPLTGEEIIAEDIIPLGGAISIDSALENSIIDGIFMYNNASYVGGAIGCMDVIKNSTISGYFINNTAEIGGAIGVQYIEDSTISGYFINNTAKIGGAIFTNYMNNTQIPAHFISNVAYREERPIRENNEIITDYFDNNGYGGALSVLGTITNSVFTGDFVNNNANVGGAIFVLTEETGDDLKLLPMANNTFNSNFIGNVAYEGAAIYISADSQQNKFNSNFINNYALNDGIIYLGEMSQGDSIFNCLFMNNTATNSVVHIEKSMGTSIINNIFLNPLRAYDIYHSGGSDTKLIANDNWFGHNSTNFKDSPKIKGIVEIDTWLFLTAAANPTSVSYLGSSDIAFSLFVYNNSTGSSDKKFDHSLLEPITLKIISTNGKVDRNAAKLNEVIKFSSNGKLGTVTAMVGYAFDTVVIKCKPRLVGNDLYMDYLEKNYRIQVFGEDGEPVEGAAIKMTVNGITYTVKSDKNGYATLKIILRPDTFKITSTYMDAILKNTIKIKKTLKAKKTFKVKQTDKNLVLKATLKWSNGKPIIGQQVLFKFKGHKYKAYTDKKGVAMLKIKDIVKTLKLGKKYKVKISYKNETVQSKVKLK
ncbi:hypothetical protein [Methanobrevibacter sp.]|uniref:hypothetical protein n=1 Tax=Methanobrevibacter sp. TaxID=66852 RepID=UPI00386FB0AF